VADKNGGGLYTCSACGSGDLVLKLNDAEKKKIAASLLTRNGARSRTASPDR